VSRTYEEARLLAAAAGHDGTVGDSRTMTRDWWPVPSTSRCRCYCGCGRRATHVGGCGGVALMSGCEFSVRRWVRDGVV
jgi:hypothetical protein